MTFPHLNGRAEKLTQELGLDRDVAEWIAVVALHSGCFMRSQYLDFHARLRYAGERFVKSLIKQKLVVEKPVKGLGLLCRVTNKNIYRLLGEEDSRHRRLVEERYLSRRLLSLDYVLDHPELHWLASEAEKVSCFNRLEIYGIDLPFRIYRGAAGYAKRYFANKHPIAVDAQKKSAVFVYADSDEKGTQGLRNWRDEHAALLSALHRKGFRLSIVHATRNSKLAAGVEKLFEEWAQAPVSREEVSRDARELRRLNQALSGDDRARLDQLGGFDTAFRRAAALERRLKNQSPPAGYKASYEVWLSKRIPSKGNKHNRLGPRHKKKHAAGDDAS